MTEREVVLITGTRKGIGLSLAQHFLRKGAAVEGCSRSPTPFAADNYFHHVTDVCDEGQVKAMISSIRTRHGRLDVAINNAGIASMNHVLLTTASSVDRVMATNLRGTFLICRESAKLMRKRRYGRIVNFGTVAVPMRIQGEAVYAASKSAVVSLTQVLAFELADFGITCNVVAPTPVETELLQGVPRAKIDSIVRCLAIKRLGRFEDIANVVDFLVRPESGYVTGQTIYLGGVG